MILLKCKMCGGALDIKEGATVCECEYCGTRQTVPSADNEKKLNLFARANRLRAVGEFDKASGVYESIVTDFPEEAEAYWGLILCRYGIEYVDDPGTGKKIPTCHRSSFNSLMDDPDFELVMEYADVIARRVYREEAKQIEELRKGIIEVSNREEPYDIFICYKETADDGQRTIDSVIAQDIYQMLTENGYRVFFSRISLEDKLGTAYEPYIFAALNSAKIMLAVGTDYEYYNAVWVKNEWSRFLQLIAKGERKTLIPCYKNIDAYDMPREFARLQAQDLGKVGAMQDLLRGIKKILPKAEEAGGGAKQQTASQTELMLKRTFLLLEDGEWAKADDFCEQVLNQEPENAQAYLGKLMTELQVKRPADLEKYGKLYATKSNYKKALRFGDAAFRNMLEAYADTNVAYMTATSKEAFEFVENKTGWTVKKLLDKELTEVVIPDFYQGKNVTAIGDYAFSSCRSLASVVIPATVNRIGTGAFGFCYSLLYVRIPRSVNAIGASAFISCRNLSDVRIPDSMTVIENDTFSGCENFVSVWIPDGVTTIGEGAFRDCKNLSEIRMPESVTTIGKDAFCLCTSLVSVTIPSGVTTIGDHAFSSCEKLERVEMPDSVTLIGENAFATCSNLRSIRIPNCIKSIGESAFYGCEKLADKDGFIIIKGVLQMYCGIEEHVRIPDNVTAIGSNAFRDNKSLIDVTIPDSVTAIGPFAYAGCINLVDVKLPDSVTDIGIGAFQGCRGLADKDGFVIFRNVLHYFCGNLTEVRIPEGVTAIGNLAFSGCESLSSVTIPDSVTEIGGMVFNACPNLKEILCFGDYGKLKDALAKNNANDKNISLCLEQGAKAVWKRREEEARKKAEQEEWLLVEYRQANGLCVHCGGTFKKGLLSTKCTGCGRKKDY